MLNPGFTSKVGASYISSEQISEFSDTYRPQIMQ